MKRLVLIIAVVIIAGMSVAQVPVGRRAMVVTKVVQGVSVAQSSLWDIQKKAQAKALAASGTYVYHPNPSALSVPQSSFSLELAKKAYSVPTVGTLMLPTMKTVEGQVITYKKEKSTERKGGGGSITMYNLMVTNHSGKDLYVFGSVRITGTVDRVGPERHFAGSVPAHSTKCLLTTIDEDFHGVKINWQDDM